MINKKKLAIQLFGHIRTFEQTFPYFKDNIISANMVDYDIDIFIHTWDEFSAMGKPNTERFRLNEPLCGKKLTKDDIDKINKLYQPKKILIEKLTVPYGGDASIEKVNRLREEYEFEIGVKYHQILYIRPDILALHPLKIDIFLEFHRKIIDNNVSNNRYIYCATSVLDRLPIITCNNGLGVGECDLVWFCNFSSKSPIRHNNAILVPIRYSLHYNFLIWRYLNVESDKDFFVRLKNSDYKKLYRENSFYVKRISDLELQLQNKTKELKNLQEDIIHKKQLLEVQNLEQDLNLKSLQTKEIQENINLKTLEKTKIQKELDQYNNVVYIERYHQSAKQRIYNHLSYKLGFCAINKSKTLWGWISMPIILLSIFISHKQEQKIYQEKIKKDPSLKLPSLELYTDYQEARKEENSFTYKLGQAIMNANKTWYKDGYVKLWFEIRKLKEKENIF